MGKPARREVIAKCYHLTQKMPSSTIGRQKEDATAITAVASFVLKQRGRRHSVALEHRLALGDEGLVGPLVVLGLHADRLRLRLGFDRLVDAHVPFLM